MAPATLQGQATSSAEKAYFINLSAEFIVRHSNSSFWREAEWYQYHSYHACLLLPSWSMKGMVQRPSDRH